MTARPSMILRTLVLAMLVSTSLVFSKQVRMRRAVVRSVGDADREVVVDTDAGRVTLTLPAETAIIAEQSAKRDDIPTPCMASCWGEVDREAGVVRAKSIIVRAADGEIPHRVTEKVVVGKLVRQEEAFRITAEGTTYDVKVPGDVWVTLRDKVEFGAIVPGAELSTVYRTDSGKNVAGTVFVRLPRKKAAEKQGPAQKPEKPGRQQTPAESQPPPKATGDSATNRRGEAFGRVALETDHTGYTIRETGNRLAKLNTSFEVGLKNSLSTLRTDLRTTWFNDDDAAHGDRCLELRGDQTYFTEMFPASPGRYTLSFAARAPRPGISLAARVMTSYQVFNRMTRPVFGRVNVKELPTSWQRYSFDVEIPEDCPVDHVTLQVFPGEQSALLEAIEHGRPMEPLSGGNASHAVYLDALAFRDGSGDTYAPPAPVELNLATPGNDHAWFYTGETAQFQLQAANISGENVDALFDIVARDVLTGQTYRPVKKQRLALSPGERRDTDLALDLPVGQFVVVARARIGGEIVTADRVLTVRTRPRLAPSEMGDSRFMGRITSTDASLEISRDIGAMSTRMHGSLYGLEWQDVEKSKGQFDWSKAEKFLARMDEVGSSYLGLFNYKARTGPPEHVLSIPAAKGAWRMQKPLPVDVAEWRRYVRAAARHFKGRIKHWEVHNEPSGVMAAECYLPHLIVAYRTARKADPDCKIVGICSTKDARGNDEGDIMPFIRRCLELGAADYMDILSFHPYVWPDSPERAGLPTLLRQITEIRDAMAPGMPLWSTEFGWCSPVLQPDRPRTERGGNMNLYGQEYTSVEVGAFCARGLLMHLAYEIDMIHFFNTPEPNILLPYRSSGLGLFDYDETPFPAYLAYREIVQRFTGAELAALESHRDHVFLTALRNPRQDELTLAFWRSEDILPSEFDDRIVFDVPGAKATVVDMFGRQLNSPSSRCEITVGSLPTYVVVATPVNEDAVLQSARTALEAAVR